VLFLRANNIQDDDVKQICQVLKPDALNPLSQKPLKVLDLSYNPITKDAVQYISEMLDVNRTLEYIGLAKCKLQTASAVKLFE
jgi:Ran GTPase-activating protein (RanGAP) involved in mRNA processing and transport